MQGEGSIRGRPILAALCHLMPSIGASPLFAGAADAGDQSDARGFRMIAMCRSRCSDGILPPRPLPLAASISCCGRRCSCGRLGGRCKPGCGGVGTRAAQILELLHGRRRPDFPAVFLCRCHAQNGDVPRVRFRSSQASSLSDPSWENRSNAMMALG
jgi:hypothetical protein